MKSKFINSILIISMVAGIVILVYPFLSNSLHEKKQDTIITEHKKAVEDLGEKMKESMWKEAEDYNKSLAVSAVLTDPFRPEGIKNINRKYYQILDTQGNGIMGYLEIPRLNLYEAIYHGTEDKVLKKGIGHLANTSFPIGGEGCHAVLTGHTGLPEAEFFTNLTQMKQGDLFSIHVLGSVLEYKVDQIKVVEPTDISDLQCVANKDYVTLVTCTPYGVNSHRLLVRGIRTEETEATREEAVRQAKEGMQTEEWRSIYGKALLEGCGIAVVLLFLIWGARRWAQRYKGGKSEEK